MNEHLNVPENIQKIIIDIENVELNLDKIQLPLRITWDKNYDWTHFQWEKF